VNHVIEPSAAGAIGKEYLVQLRMGEGERPNDIFGGGHYEDVYVRTPDGWRFKQRQFIPSEKGVGGGFPPVVKPETPPAPFFGPRRRRPGVPRSRRSTTSRSSSS